MPQQEHWQWPPDRQRRFEELIARRQDFTISPSALQELIALAEESERRDAERLAALIALAEARGMDLSELIQRQGPFPNRLQTGSVDGEA